MGMRAFVGMVWGSGGVGSGNGLKWNKDVGGQSGWREGAGEGGVWLGWFQCRKGSAGVGWREVPGPPF